MINCIHMQSSQSNSHGVTFPKKRSGLLPFLQNISLGAVYSLFFLIPLFFLPWTTDFFEINKQTLFLFLTLIGILPWLGAMVKSRTIIFQAGWLLLAPVGLLINYIASAVVNSSGFLSWVGTSTQEYTSVLSMAGFVLLFIFLSNVTKSHLVQARIFLLMTLSACVSVLIGLASVLGLFDMGAGSFNTIGTLTGFGIYISIMLVFASGLWMQGVDAKWPLPKKQRKAQDVLILFFTVLSLTSLFLLDYWVYWVVLLAGLAVLCVSIFVCSKQFQKSPRYILPLFIFAFGTVLLFIPSLYNTDLPVEITLNQSASWSIAQDTLENNSFWFGSGPGTYSFDYDAYRLSDVNATSLWNTRFDKSFSHVLTMLPTLGASTLIFWGLFVLSLSLASLSRLLKRGHTKEWEYQFILFPAFFSVVVASFLYGSNITLQFLFFGFAGLMAAHLMTKSFDKSFVRARRFGYALSVVFMILFIGIITMLFMTMQRYAAEVSFTESVRLSRDNAPNVEVIEMLEKATVFNRFQDVYFRNYAQALIFQIQDELSQDGVEEYLNMNRGRMQALSAESINAAVRATQLDDKNVMNWLIRGSVYRSLIPLIGDAEQFSIDAYETAVKLSPLNPSYRTELGMTYLVAAEQVRPLTAAEDKEVRIASQTRLEESLEKAEIQFLQAVELKSDYGPAHYQLALTYERQGRLEEAITKMENVAVYNPLDVGVLFQLGLLQLRVGDIEKAQILFERSVDLVPSHANALWFLASIHEQKGEMALAVQYIERVSEFNPGNAIVAARLNRLRAGQTVDKIPELLLEN